MNNDFFEQPQQNDVPIRTKVETPWTRRVEYKSGKVQEVFASGATPEQVKAGFSYYDKEEKKNVRIETFTASIVAITFGVSGTVLDGKGYINYMSNLVFDTRNQPLEVFYWAGVGDDRKKISIATGFYSDFRATLPNGVSYSKVLIAYIHETGELASFQMSAAMEGALKEGIATATGRKPGQISIYEIAKSDERFWTFRFSGVFFKRTKEGAAWDGKGDMYFYPELTCGVMSAENVPVLPRHKQAVVNYIEQSQKYIWEDAVKKGESVSASAPKQQSPPVDHQAPSFPTVETQSYQEEETLPF